MNGRQGVVTMASLILGHPAPVEEVGRVIRMMDEEQKQKETQSQASVKAAKAMAKDWVELPCGKSMKPVQDVLRVLLGYIGDLEGAK